MSQFDLLAPIYDNMDILPFRKEIEIPSVLKMLGDISGMSVLDFGCGSGYYACLLKKRGAKRVVGYDIANGMLEYARNKELINPLGIEYVSTLDNLEQQFDLVLGVYVLPYADSREKLQSMVNNMVKLIRPGGRLLTLPLNPKYSIISDYYVPYGFKIVSDFPYQDGSTFQLHFLYNTPHIINGWYWSYEVLNNAFKKSGLTNIQWSKPNVKDSSLSTQFSRYINNPHTVMVSASYI